MMLSIVVLPEPRRPEQRQELAGVGEINSVDGYERPEPLVQCTELQLDSWARGAVRHGISLLFE